MSIRKSRLIILLCHVLLILCACQPTTGDFSIMLLSQPLTADQADALALNQLPLQPVPFLTSADLLGYTQSTHSLELTQSAYARLKQLQVPVHGLPFVVSVGAERIYSGAFWTLISSVSYSGIVILQPFYPEGTNIRIEPGYPGTGFFRGSDPRSDRRVMDALRFANKLK